MKQIWLTVVVAVSSVAVTSARQSPKPAAPKIPECEKYEAMVAACLPKMCEADRAVAEIDLELHREMLPVQIQHKGRAAAAKTCAAQIDEAVREDVFGCYAAKGGMTATVRPTATSVVMTLTGPGPSGAGADVVILAEPGDAPTATFRLPAWKGEFVLDTASTPVVANGGAKGAPTRLEPATTYCYAIGSATDIRNDVYRKGMFTTLPKR